MILKGKQCIVFDVESLKNVFTCTCKNTETQQLITFELSERKNQIQEMCDYFGSDAYFIGYNNIHYDNVIINYCLEFRDKELTTRRWTESLYNLSHLIIGSKDDSGFDKWKRWKYANNFHTIDLLTMMYSKALRVSLKEMQVTMHYHNVEEFEVDWHRDLPVSDIDKLISYNINDVNSTEALLNRLKDRLELRIGIENEYGIQCLSTDDVNIGMKILAHEYMKKTGISKKQLEAMRSPAEVIDLEKVILPSISFRNPILQKALVRMKEQHNVSPGRKGYEDTFILGGMKTTIGVGGIHGDCGTCIIKPKENEMLIDEDVTSLYPSLMIEYGFYPPHLGEEFLEVYSEIRTKRIEAKRNGNKLINECFKFCLNGLSGNLQNEYSWAYSPFTVMQIRINGQLLLLMLAERLLEIGCKLKQINTDGILFILDKSRYDDYLDITKSWQEETKLQLEREEFKSFYQVAINDYFGVYTNGKIKQKGLFITDTLLGKGLSPKIVPEALINYFEHGIPVEETVYNCNDIRKFLQSEKTGKQWTVEYDGRPQQRTNRFYVAKDGLYLWKYKKEGSETQYNNMLKGYGVRLHNQLISDSDLNWMYSHQETFNTIYNVDYSYYIKQTNKVIEQLKPRQMSLWDFDQ